MTVIVPSRSLVTKASGPAGFEVQLASMSANKTFTQRRKDAKPARLQVAAFASLRLCVKISSLKLMLDTAPPATASTPQHHTTTAGVLDPTNPTGPSVFGNPLCASLGKHATTRARCATPPNAPASRNSPPETPTQNSALY